MKTFILKVLIFTGLTVIIFSCRDRLEDPSGIKPETKMDSIAYIIGLDYGQGVREQQIDIDPALVYRGFYDAMNDTSLLSDSLKEAMITEFNDELTRKLEIEEQKLLKENLTAGVEFMEKNKNQPGVVTLPSGLQYKALKEGTGSYPQPNDSVLIHYRAMFIDRSVFDMSYDRGPAGIKLSNVIDGLAQGIMLMKPGAIYELYIPPELGYGDENFANVIPAGSTLIYSIELVEIFD